MSATETTPTTQDETALMGVGVHRLVRCPSCRGNGHRVNGGPDPEWGWIKWVEDCRECKGTGKVHHSFSQRYEKSTTGDGNLDIVIPTCHCGWEGSGVANYNADQFTRLRSQYDAHISSPNTQEELSRP
jgi:hypothetical protein